MTGDEFAALLNDFTLSAESGDGARFASHFTEDGIYYDYIYGAHQGRADIAHMMQDLFHRDAADYRWEMFDPVFDGRQGYAWSLSSFTSKIEQFKGQRVVIDVDAYGGREFTGKVDRIAGATGARFSLLPPENATGNYVKIVQRVPVKIVLDPGQDSEHRLRPGMSVTPTVYTRQ